MAVALNLTAHTDEQREILEYLKESASPVLAEKINNGIRATETDADGTHEVIRRKDLDDCWSFIVGEAKKHLNGRNGGIANATVYGWAVHYFEEDSIEGGKLYNTDGSLFVSKPLEKPKKNKGEAKQGAAVPETPSKAQKVKAEEAPAKEISKQTAKPANKKAATKSAPKKLSGQMSLFDLMGEEKK